MNSVKSIFIVVALGLCLIGTSSCKGKSGQKDSKESETRTTVQTTLFDKSLPEIKELVEGKWELVSGQNTTQLCEFENTFIQFNGDKYVWTEEGKDEPGDLNWRKANTGAGLRSLSDGCVFRNESFLSVSYQRRYTIYPGLYRDSL